MLFPLAYGALGLFRHSAKPTVLPEDVPGLLFTAFFEFSIFIALFACAWFFSRANADQLLLRWRGKGRPVLLGLAYSVMLRIAIMCIALAVMVVWMLLTGAREKDLQSFRPQTEHLINAGAMLTSPVYFTLCLTLISFVVAGLREELWRAGMFAGLNALFPKQFADWRGKAASVCFVAMLFGLGHSIQGLAGVGITAVLGVGLGAIMLWQKSIWEAVIAHGFFDATTFVMMYVIVKYYPHTFPGLG